MKRWIVILTTEEAKREKIAVLLSFQMHQDGWESVQVHVREKKKWKRYPCAVRGKSFVQFKDNKVRQDLPYNSKLQIFGPSYPIQLKLSYLHPLLRIMSLHTPAIIEVFRMVS